VEMDVGERGCDGMDCIHLAQDMDKCGAFVNEVMNLWFTKKLYKFLSGYATRGLSSSENNPSSHLTADTLRLRYRAQPVNAM
jgi:hypothetical protein